MDFRQKNTNHSILWLVFFMTDQELKLGFPIVLNTKVFHFSYSDDFFEDFVTKNNTFFSFISNWNFFLFIVK